MTGQYAVRGVWATVLALTILAPAPAAVAQADPLLQGLEAAIERGMRDWEIPGLAIAVVQGDSVVYARGFGVRELGRSEPVDEHTLFAIGSASKAFTAAAVAMLVDEERLRWDDPATLHLPDFQLFDPWATRQMTVRDLLTHRVGLARGDQLWYASGLDRDEILRRTRFLEPSWGFRAEFGYQNLMYLAAGQLVPALTGRSWDDFVADRIFAPLGMATSSTSTLGLDAMPNVARPHAEIDGRLRPVPYRNIDNVGPAGSINSSVHEMARWIRLQLHGGSFEGRRLLEEATVAEMHSPFMLVRRTGRWVDMSPISNFMAYGLGWFLNDHHGRMVVQHGGNIDGMHALVGMLPAERVGVVVLTNRSGNSLTYALMYHLFDVALGEAPEDWNARLLASRDTARAQAESARAQSEAARVADTEPSLPLERYAGAYDHTMYGTVTVRANAGGLVLERGAELVADLDHWHYDTFRAVWRDPVVGSSFVVFSLDARARPARLELPGMGMFQRQRDVDGR
jgi:CubicO group peptidase (beta-lactamase class C family)